LNRFNDPLEDKVIKCVVEGTLQSTQAKKNEKRPLSASFVRSILRSADASSLLDLRNCCIIALAYSLLLRYDEISHMCCNHLSKVPEGLKILIPSSKTDVYRSGKSVFLATSVHSFLMSYLRKANLQLGENQFLFSPMMYAPQSGDPFIGNKILSYNSYRIVLREKLQVCGLNPDLYGFHSCRKGGVHQSCPSCFPI
jgi:site-specific recombinase XerD